MLVARRVVLLVYLPLASFELVMDSIKSESPNKDDNLISLKHVVTVGVTITVN